MEKIQGVLALHHLTQYCFAIVPFSNRSQKNLHYTILNHFLLYIPCIAPFYRYANGTIQIIDGTMQGILAGIMIYSLHYTIFRSPLLLKTRTVPFFHQWFISKQLQTSHSTVLHNTTFLRNSRWYYARNTCICLFGLRNTIYYFIYVIFNYLFT